jgi:aminopeptidase
MRDPRIANLAKVLTRYCIEAKRGQTIGVRGGLPAVPLLEDIYRELLDVGAFSDIRIVPDSFASTFFRHARAFSLQNLPPLERARARCVDASIAVHSEENTRSLSAVDPRKQAALSRTWAPVRRAMMKKPWVVTLLPTQAFAQDAEMSLADYEDFVYGAMFVDEPRPVDRWRELKRDQDRLIARLRGADRIRIVADDTDLEFSVKGRTFINSDGHRNMPSGEVFTSPQESSAEGYIRYDFPVCTGGREVSGIRLVFRKGVVVEAGADKNADYLKRMLDSDPGARRLGELGIGTNRRIQRFTRQILFDEKIGGTVHLALGQSYAETGGRNHSALHWDMIKDLRRGGTLYVNGKAFQKDGRFVRG